jgi:hypothetical protein
MRRRVAQVERQIRNCTEAIASMGLSNFLRKQLTDLEEQHKELAEKLALIEPRAAKLQLRDTRRFVEVRLRNLQSMLTGEARLARAEIAKHVEKIILTPEGKTYIASGTWDLLGNVAVRMVPGARHGPNVCPFTSGGWLRPLEHVTGGYRAKTTSPITAFGRSRPAADAAREVAERWLLDGLNVNVGHRRCSRDPSSKNDAGGTPAS